MKNHLRIRNEIIGGTGPARSWLETDQIPILNWKMSLNRDGPMCFKQIKLLTKQNIKNRYRNIFTKVPRSGYNNKKTKNIAIASKKPKFNVS